jgi:hypothetical protein
VPNLHRPKCRLSARSRPTEISSHRAPSSSIFYSTKCSSASPRISTERCEKARSWAKRLSGSGRADEKITLFSVLLEVHPELRIRPILIGVGAQILLDIRTGEEMTIAGLERQFAIHEKARPNEVQFVAEVPLGIVRP